MPKETFFVDESLGDLLKEPEKIDDVVEGEQDEVEEIITNEEIAELEKAKGDKLTEEELSELKKVKSEKEEEVEVEVADDFALIKPDKLPKELKPHFNRMLAAYTRKMEKLANVEKKAELWDYIQDNPEFFTNKFGTPVKTKTEGVESSEETFLKQLNLPEDNELTPALKTLALTIHKNIVDSQVESAKTKQDTIKVSIKNWLDANEAIKGDKELLSKMDELGMENPKLYLNLKRLYKFAEAELDRPVRKERTKTTLDIVNLYKEMQKAKKQKVFKPSSDSKNLEVKKPKNVREAFDLAESQLKRERK